MPQRKASVLVKERAAVTEPRNSHTENEGLAPERSRLQNDFYNSYKSQIKYELDCVLANGEPEDWAVLHSILEAMVSVPCDIFTAIAEVLGRHGDTPKSRPEDAGSIFERGRKLAQEA